MTKSAPMGDGPTPIRVLEIDLATALRLRPADRVLVAGHEAHFVLATSLEGSQTSTWITISCSCGKTLGGEITAAARSAPIEVVESPSIEINGPPLTGTCTSCGADIDALARTGVTGHVCFGPGDATNNREPS
jgi:hypothetical protein